MAETLRDVTKKIVAYCMRCRSAQYHDKIDGEYVCLRCYHRGGIGDAR